MRMASFLLWRWEYYGWMKISSIILSGILLGVAGAHGQNTPAKTTDPAPVTSANAPHFAFDVVSVRESGEGNMSFIHNLPHTSSYTAERLTVQGLILGAYGIRQFFLLKGDLPSWATTNRYSITAKADPSVDEVLAKLSQDDAYVEKNYMLQSMLADRFKLKIHTEAREADVYELVRTKQAEKLMTPVEVSDPKTEITCYPSYRSSKGVEIEAKGCVLSKLVNSLQSDLQATVIDHTGMTGKYAFDLKWCPDALALRNDEEHYPSLMDALREQLGLELKRTKGPVTFWVVDHVEAPSAN